MGQVSEEIRHHQAVRIAAFGTIATVVYAALGIVQILVLNPLAAVPGRTLAQIQSDLAADGGLGFGWVVMLLGPAFAVWQLMRVRRQSDQDPSRVVGVYLALLALGTPAYSFASFGAGMALADGYGLCGCDHSPWAIPLFVVSFAAVVGLLWLALRHSLAGR